MKRSPSLLVVLSWGFHLAVAVAIGILVVKGANVGWRHPLWAVYFVLGAITLVYVVPALSVVLSFVSLLRRVERFFSKS